MSLATLFALLLFGHAIMDFPMQGDFLARAKNSKTPIAGIPWPLALSWHAYLHAGAVSLFTGSMLLGAFEFWCHVVIDFAKSEGVLGAGERAFVIDQALHIGCKAVWILLLSRMP